MHLRLRIALLVLTALACGGGMSSADTGDMKTVIYPVVYGDMDALEEFARTVVAEGGHVVKDAQGRRLIVVTTSGRHETLNEVLGDADAMAGNVRIDVRFRETGVTRDAGAAVRGEGEVVFGPGGPNGTIVLRPEVRHTVTEMIDDTRQMLMAASGREAVLRVGESVPYIDWITEYGWYGGYTESRIQWQDVGSFLVMTPTIMGDGSTIHVRLTPELRGHADGQPQRVRFAGVSTEVLVRDGQTISLGGHIEDQSFYRRFLVGVDRSGAQRQLDIELTPHIVRVEGR